MNVDKVITENKAFTDLILASKKQAMTVFVLFLKDKYFIRPQ